MKIPYNTSETHLQIPAYGRLVQRMIDQALMLNDKEVQQRHAERIIRVMDVLNPSLRSRPERMEILWNHLAYMSGYALDITYPCAIERRDEMPAHKLAYPGHKIHMRHYGALIEMALKQLKDMPADAPGREAYIRDIGARMKRCLAQWRGDSAENEKVAFDMEAYTEGKVTAAESVEALSSVKLRNYTPLRNGGKFDNRKQNRIRR